MSTRTVRRAAVAAVTVLLLAGCGPSGATVPTASPSVQASTTPTPTPSPTAVAYTQPARLFAGNCADVATDAQMSTVFGEPVVSRPAYDSVTSPKAAYEEQWGGLECTWVTANYRWGASILLLPEGAAPVATEACTNSGIEAGGQYSCSLETVLSGMQVSGLLWGSGTSRKPTATAAQAFKDVLAMSASAATPVALPSLPPGSWAHPMACEATLGSIDFASIYGAGAQPWEDGGNDSYSPRALGALWGGQTGSCGVFGESDLLSVQWLGGGRWSESLIAQRDGAREVPFEGVELAIQSPAEYGGTRLDIFDGPNWLSAVFVDAEADTVAIQAILAALDEQ